MKTSPLVLVIALVTLAARAEEAPKEFDIFTPSEMSKRWKPNNTLWRELTTTRSNLTASIPGTEMRMRGPLVEAYHAGRRSAGERPGVVQTLLAVPVGIVSLFVPQPMPRPPENGGRYFRWGERSEAWGTQMGAAADSGGGLLSFGW